MASKVTSLYAETRILLNLWALDETPASKSKFVPGGKPYASALTELVERGELIKEKGVRSQVYTLTQQGSSQLEKGLLSEEFGFSTSIGPKTTNAILSWLRQNGTGKSDQSSGNSTSTSTVDSERSDESIHSYKAFSEAALDTYDQLNRDYNLGNLVPIYRIRRVLGDRLSRQQFNEWLLEIQANDLVQLMGGDLPNVTKDQLEDSVAIPGGGTRFYVKRL